jgi:histone H3/H4
MEKPAVKPAAKEYELSHSAVARIVKKNGVARIGPDAVDVIRGKAEEYIGQLTKKAQAAATHASRKIIRTEDVQFVLT